MGKLLASYVIKVDPDPEPSVLVEPDIVYEPNLEVVDTPELEPEVEEPLIDTLVDLSAELTM